MAAIVSDDDFEMDFNAKEIRIKGSKSSYSVLDLHNFLANADKNCIVCNKLRMKDEKGFVARDGDYTIACEQVCSTWLSWTERSKEPWRKYS